MDFYSFWYVYWKVSNARGLCWETEMVFQDRSNHHWRAANRWPKWIWNTPLFMKTIASNHSTLRWFLYRVHSCHVFTHFIADSADANEVALSIATYCNS